MTDLKSDEIVKAKSLVANMRQGKGKELSKDEHALLDRYFQFRKAQPYERKRLGKTVPVEAISLDGVTMTNLYGSKLNGFVKNAIVSRVNADVEFAKANKMKELVFRGGEKAEQKAAKEEREAEKKQRKSAREKRKAEKEADSKVRAKKREERKEARKKKVMEQAKALGIKV